MLALLPLVARDLIERRAADLRHPARRVRHRRGRRRLRSARGCASDCRASGSCASPSPALPSAPSIAAPQHQRLADLRGRCCSAAPAGCWRWRCSTSPCRCRRRAGWSAGRCRSTRRRPSAAWRWAAGSGAWRPKATRPEQALLAAAAVMIVGGLLGLALAAAGANGAQSRPAQPLERAASRRWISSRAAARSSS